MVGSIVCGVDESASAQWMTSSRGTDTSIDALMRWEWEGGAAASRSEPMANRSRAVAPPEPPRESGSSSV